MIEEHHNKDKGNENITLSAALLAPINSIFEAQIHSARAFLNFILQMGFRHTRSRKEFETDEEYNNYVKDTLNQKKKMKELFKRRETDI